jgi:para-aminobenzoate synthetase / 4-amino-4-deoxychorismate lyase
VLLCNAAGEVTETAIANFVAELDGALCTPPLECGLLPGTARAELLARGVLREQVLPVARLPECPRLYTLNSVRGLRPAVLDPAPPAPPLAT